MSSEHFTPVPLDKAYRLLNHGPTVLVSAQHAGERNVMAAARAQIKRMARLQRAGLFLDMIEISTTRMDRARHIGGGPRSELAANDGIMGLGHGLSFRPFRCMQLYPVTLNIIILL